MIKPPISRMGGKSKLRNKIINMLPSHTTYIELFFGAGWVYFGKDKSKVEVINDIDKELINLFKIIKYHTPEIKRLLEYEFSGRDIFEEYKNATLEHLTDIHRAIRFLYLINNSFAGKGKFILTINDHEKVREWYKDFNIEEVDVNYSISKEKSGRGKYKELIITNY